MTRHDEKSACASREYSLIIRAAVARKGGAASREHSLIIKNTTM